MRQYLKKNKNLCFIPIGGHVGTFGGCFRTRTWTNFGCCYLLYQFHQFEYLSLKKSIVTWRNSNTLSLCSLVCLPCSISDSYCQSHHREQYSHRIVIDLNWVLYFLLKSQPIYIIQVYNYFWYENSWFTSMLLPIGLVQ